MKKEMSFDELLFFGLNCKSKKRKKSKKKSKKAPK